MSDRAPTPPARRRPTQAPRTAPVWRQVLEGIGLVVVLSAVVAGVGALVALVVSLFF